MYKHQRIFIVLVLLLILCSDLLAQPFTEGNSYSGRNSYIEFLCGGLPLIISAPHGGDLTPSEIPDRTCGTTVTDSYTEDLTMELRDAIYDITGRYPHVIINHLKRIKMDANRAQAEASCGDNEAAIAWEEYHTYIDSAKLHVNTNYSKGLFIDMHGQSSHGERIELGYLLSGSELGLPAATLNTSTYSDKCSIKNLVASNVNSYSLTELLNGTSSLGALLEDKGYTTIPSYDHEYPTDSYFSGGYNTERHGSKNGGAIDGIQMECNRAIRFDEGDRQTYATKLAGILLAYLKEHYFPNLESYYNNGSAIDDIEYGYVSYYPNPVRHFLHVKTLVPVSMHIINLFGQEVFAEKLSGEKDISLAYLNDGIYIVVFRQNGQIVKNGKILIDKGN